ncbi:MAG: hypothetical protein K8G79_04125 [bacterium]|uniref:Uncharacterized protein n=1 Tax=Candidatus Methylomirabilis tolerans TaxID=3123416 RepID=A0AAJ1EI47_9BACT|nr:hypothetical protein [Candidatus Methylomirabilis sp.]
MPWAGTDFRVDEDVRVDRPHCSSAIHEVEQLVAIREVNAGLESSIPILQLQCVPTTPSPGRQRLPKHLVHESGKSLPLSGSAAFERLQEIRRVRGSFFLCINV